MNDIFLKLMFNTLKKYMNFIIIYQFLPERMKIKKFEKLVTNLHDKNEYVIRTRNLKLALNYGLVLKEVCRVNKFNQKAWLKPDIDMNTKLRKKAKNNFETDFVRLLNNASFGKTAENVRKLVPTERRRIYLAEEQKHHTAKFFTENLLAIEMRKTQMLMKKLVYLVLSILDLIKTAMYGFW